MRGDYFQESCVAIYTGGGAHCQLLHRRCTTSGPRHFPGFSPVYAQWILMMRHAWIMLLCVGCNRFHSARLCIADLLMISQRDVGKSRTLDLDIHTVCDDMTIRAQRGQYYWSAVLGELFRQNLHQNIGRGYSRRIASGAVLFAPRSSLTSLSFWDLALA
jgi:hypothetical protein